jgi:hypothetical protein
MKTSAQQQPAASTLFDDDDNDDTVLEQELGKSPAQPTQSHSQSTRTDHHNDELADAGTVNEIDVGSTEQPRYKYKGDYMILADGDLWAVE